MAIRDALIALLAAFDDLAADSDLAGELAELLYNFRVPDTGDTAVVAPETADVLRVPGAMDTAVATVTQGTSLKVWRDRVVDGATWYFVSEASGSTVTGWMASAWLTVTTGSRPAASYNAPGLRSGATVGVSPNYAQFDATGHLTWAGTGRPWRDELGELIGKKRKGTRITEDLDEGTVTFADTCQIADDWVIANVQLNHDKDLTASIYPHLHWFQASANVPNWLIEYRWQVNGGAKTTAWTRAKYTGQAFTYTSGTLHQISVFAGIAPPVGSTLSDIVQFRILRDTDNDSTLFAGADPLTGNASALMFDTHFMLNSVGSTDEYAK